MAFTENAADFLNADTPGYVLATVGGATVGALFDNDSQSVGVGFAGMEASKPSILCATGDVATAAHGTAVVIGAISYSVAEIYPDGQGMTRLALKLA